MAISAKNDLLWEALRRERASRRNQMENALNVIAEDVEHPRSEPSVTVGSIDAA